MTHLRTIRNVPLTGAHAHFMRHHWSIGLSELSSVTELECAWHSTLSQWRALLIHAEPDQTAQRRWLQQRLRLIYALRKYQQIQATLRLAQCGQATWEFVPWLDHKNLWNEPTNSEIP